MLHSIHVDRPCSEDWEAMSRLPQGRFCTLCAHSVMDFTGWTQEAIADYLVQQAGQRVCGRFHDAQLQQDYLLPDTFLWQLHRSALPFLKQVAALILFVFLPMQQALAQSASHVRRAGIPQKESKNRPAPEKNPQSKPAVTERSWITAGIVSIYPSLPHQTPAPVQPMPETPAPKTTKPTGSKRSGPLPPLKRGK